MWTGGILVGLTIILSLMSGLYTEYFFCKDFEKQTLEQEQNRAIPGATTAEAQIQWQKDFETRLKCVASSDKIFTSYIAIILGISLVVGGFITGKKVKK